MEKFGQFMAIRRFSPRTMNCRSIAENRTLIIGADRSNATSVIVDKLAASQVFYEYAHSSRMTDCAQEYIFSVRAENSAGNSSFGPETLVTTLGQRECVSGSRTDCLLNDKNFSL